MLACSSPKLFAACHVLLRRLVPRHPPCALIHLTSNRFALLAQDVVGLRSRLDRRTVVRLTRLASPAYSCTQNHSRLPRPPRRARRYAALPSTVGSADSFYASVSLKDTAPFASTPIGRLLSRFDSYGASLESQRLRPLLSLSPWFSISWPLQGRVGLVARRTPARDRAEVGLIKYGPHRICAWTVLLYMRTEVRVFRRVDL